MELEALKALAVSMLEKAYCPYSHFPVGAALECADGSVYTGCNVENAVYPAGICAERTAFFKAVYDGHRDFSAIAVCGGKDGIISDVFPPCGICRQVMQEFAPNLTVICLNGKGEAKTFALKELLPYGFDNRWLPEEK